MALSSPADRRAGRAKLFASAMSRRGGALSETPRDDIAIAETSVTAPHEIEAARVRPQRGELPHPDGHHEPASP